MRKVIVSMILASALCLLPLRVAQGAATAASDTQGYKILLSDGTVLRGTLAFTLNLDTQFGRLSVPSTNFISANFDSTGDWAQIRTSSIELRVQYKPDTSDLQVTTDAGPVTVTLSKVVSMQSLSAEASTAVAAAPNPYGQPTAPYPEAYPYSDIYSQPYDMTPYEYGAPAPYYWPSYYPTQPFSYEAAYPSCWEPLFGLGGFVVISNFDFDHHHHDRDFDHHRGFGRFDDDHHGRFDNVFESRNFHASWNGTWNSAAAGSGVRFNQTAGVNRSFSSFRASTPQFFTNTTPSFRSTMPSFRSASFSTPAPTFRSAPSFRSGFSSPSFGGGGFLHSAGVAHSWSGGGSFSHGGFGGGGFGGRR